jgi:hypothetical protein
MVGTIDSFAQHDMSRPIKLDEQQTRKLVPDLKGTLAGSVFRERGADTAIPANRPAILRSTGHLAAGHLEVAMLLVPGEGLDRHVVEYVGGNQPRGLAL